jgi:hypothetical protein
MRAISTDGADGVILRSNHYWPYTDEPWVVGVLARYDRTDARTDTLVRFDYMPGLRRGETENVLLGGGWAAASPHNLVTTRGDRTQVERYTLDGRLEQLIRWTEDRRSFDEEAWWAEYEAYQWSFRTPSPQAEVALARWRAAAEGPPPHSAGLLTDDAGNVWVGEYSADPRYPPRYRVFSETGLFRGWVVMPPRFEILDVAPGLVLGVHRNDLDVAAVALYPIEE